jgi:CBS domain-containing protein
MKVSEIMSKSVVSVEAEETLQAAAQKMKNADIGCLPVVHGEHLEGVLTDRDIVLCSVATGSDPKRTQVAQCEHETVWCVSPDEEIEKAASVMKEHRVRRIPVVKGDRLVGMLSLSDMARRSDLQQLSEEVLAEVSRVA